MPRALKQTRSLDYQCSGCLSGFSFEDLESGLLWETGMCVRCYQRMAESKTGCFGRSYDSQRVECKTLCPDRTACLHWAQLEKLPFVQVEERARSKAQTSIFPEPARNAVFEMAQRGSTVDEIVEVCRKLGLNPDVELRIFRKGSFRGRRWRVIERVKTGYFEVKV